MIRPNEAARRRGTIIPLTAVCLVGLVGCVALAVDIGLVAQARTDMQDALDAALLAGVRQIDGVSSHNNIVTAINTAYAIAEANTIIGAPITQSDITNFQVGTYVYTSGSGFSPNWTATVAGPGSDPGAAPTGQNYGAMKMSMQHDQYTVFGRVFGLNSFRINISDSTAVHRPRDVAIVLDFSGSMCFGCLHNNAYVQGAGSASMQSANYDPYFPQFGPWSIFPSDDPAAPTGQASISPMQMMKSYNDSSYSYAPSNVSYGTPNHGGPIVNDFTCLFGGSYNARAWCSGITPFTNTYPAVASWNPLSTANATVMPAPKELVNQNVAQWTGTSWFGDKWPYNTASPSNPPLTTEYAKTVQEYVNFLYAQGKTGTNNNIPDPTKKYTNSPTNTQGGGMWWEANGYEGATGNTFCGYTMGPGYYGKTFYMWPPDPHTPANCTSGNTYPTAGESPSAAKARGYVPGDWRQRFFNPPDNNNSLFWDTSTNQWKDSSAPTVNYTNVIQWIKGGPQVFPPTLQCGRVLYYSAIPDTIPSSGGTADQVWWRNYIDYVMGTGSYADQNYLYGRNSSHQWTNPATGTTRSWGPIQVTNYSPTASTPYMNYADNPIHPRAQFWFGPVTMVCFMQHYISAAGGNDSFMPGACHESQAWELKAAVQSALVDMQKNHPNDWVSLIYFSSNSGYNQPRSVLSNDYATPQLYLWYPFRISGQTPTTYLASTPNASTGSGFIRPYFNGSTWPGPITDQSIIPVAHNGTCYDMGLKVAFNQFSANSSAASSGGKGRIGARKLVIFETDGVVNTAAGGSPTLSGSPSMSYYSTDAQIGTTSSITSGDSSYAVAVINNMRSSTNGWGNQLHVHCIGFGDVLESSSPATSRTKAINVLNAMQGAGGTSNPIEGYKLITGTYQNRISSLKTAFQRIMQGDIQIALTQ